MPRKPRIEFDGAVYHVMSRGNRKENVFHSNRDYSSFLKTLSEACTRTGWKLHAYVLLPNHYHLLLETPEPNLTAGMKWLQATYAMRFNLRNDLVGHVFQGRYKALPVDPSKGNYFLTVADYIHLNPMRANLINFPPDGLEDYKWSSLPFYINSERQPVNIETERTFRNLRLTGSQNGRAAYKHHLTKKAEQIIASPNPMLADKQWSQIRRGWYIGSDEYRKKLIEQQGKFLKQVKHTSLFGESIREHNEKEAACLISTALKLFNMSEDKLLNTPKGTEEKALLAWLIRTRTTASRDWISAHLHIGHASRVSKLVKQVNTDPRFNELKNLLLSI